MKWGGDMQDRRNFLAGLRKIRSLFSRRADLLANLRGRVKGETPAAVQAEAPNAPLLSIRTEKDLAELLELLEDMEGMEKAARLLPSPDAYCRELNNIRDKIRRLPENRKLAVIDEESGEFVADQLIRLFPRIGNLLKPCLEKEDSRPHAQLASEIEKYLLKIGIGSVEIAEGASSDEWIDLNMDYDMVHEATTDPAKVNTIGKIFMRPRLIRFLNSLDEVEERYFGGRCLVYIRAEQ